MRVVIFGINYWPEVIGIGAFSTCRAEYLSSSGHEVTVCTTFPYYPGWKVPPQYRGRLMAREQLKGVRILRTYAYGPSKVTSFRRVSHNASFVLSSLICALVQKRPDVLFVVSPPLGLTITARLLTPIWRILSVYDVEDLQPDAASDLGMLPAWILRVMYRSERTAYCHASVVSTLTRSMRRKIAEKDVPADKLELFEPRAHESLTIIDPEEGRGFRHISLVTQLQSVSDIVFASKAVTYLTAGCPVIASISRSSEVAQTIEESRAGRLVEPESSAALLQSIRALALEDLAEYRTRAKEYALKRWSSQRVLGHFERTLVAVSELRTISKARAVNFDPGDHSKMIKWIHHLNPTAGSSLSLLLHAMSGRLNSTYPQLLVRLAFAVSSVDSTTRYGRRSREEDRSIELLSRLYHHSSSPDHLRGWVLVD
jgi:hypothetical protein